MPTTQMDLIADAGSDEGVGSVSVDRDHLLKLIRSFLNMGMGPKTYDELKHYADLLEAGANLTPLAPKLPHWEAVPDGDDSTFWRVRWSEPDADGRWLYISHYGTPGIADVMAKRDAEEQNRRCRLPWETHGWRCTPSQNKD